MSDQENDPQLLQEVEDDVQRRKESRESNDRLLAMPVYVEKPEVVVELPNVLDDDSAYLSPEERAAGTTLAHKLEARQADIAGGRDSAHHYIPTEDDEEAQTQAAGFVSAQALRNDNMFEAMAELDDSQAKLVRAILVGVDNQYRTNNNARSYEDNRVKDFKARILNYADELEATIGDWTPKDVIANLHSLVENGSNVPTVLEAKKSLFLAGL